MPTELPLFPTADVNPAADAVPVTNKPAPRVQRPNRAQIQLRPLDLESLVPADHRVRVVWAFVEGLDLQELYDAIRAVEGAVGRSPIDPRIHTALWLYATLDGVGSARALARLTKEHHAYQWICGGVSTNYHTLADFRVANPELIDRLLTTSAASLMAEGLVTMKRVAQDGMRVRASAGAASFRRKDALTECLREAEEQVAALRRELDADPGVATRREQAARARAARQRQERVAAALAQLPKVEAAKKAADRDKARASTTDPEARVMKMGDGGFRPAFNVEFATDSATQVITGASVVDTVDQGQMPAMVDEHQRRYGRVPDEYLVDGGFTVKEDIAQVAAGGTTVYAPVAKPKDAHRDPHTPLPGDAPAVAAWRIRMGTEEAKAIYKDRAATAECVNALARQRGLQQFRVRGRKKVLAVVLWYALAHNLLRAAAIRAAAARS